MTFSITNINWIAFLISTFLSHCLGGVWFGERWLKYSGFTMEEMKKRHGGSAFMKCFIGQLFVNFTLAVLIQGLNAENLISAIGIATLAYIGFVATVEFHNVLWSGKRIEFFLINTSHKLATMIVGAGSYYYITSKF